MLMNDGNFKKAVPEAEGVKFGFDVIHGLFSSNKELKESRNRRHRSRSCCCCHCFAVVVSHYHHRYQLSKAAKLKAAHIQEHIIDKCPPNDNLTISKNAADLKQIPNQFSKAAVKSRTTLLHLIVDKLKDGSSDVVGVFGMGGTGKTTLAKEVVHRAKTVFDKIVMVEVSSSPNILRIQGEIALSIGLSLVEVDSTAQMAIRLYNQLTSDKEKEKKTLVILDNIWKKLNLGEVGIPRTCKLVLTTRDKEVCRVMGVQDRNIHEVGLLTVKEAKDMFKSQAGDRVDAKEYKGVVDRLMSKCGGLPLTIVATANTLKDKDLANWRKFADELDKPISTQVVNGEHREAYLILETSYLFMESEEKRLFFLLASLSPVDSSVSVEELMRYGIGLDLFQHVNKLSEAIEQANGWAEELVSSSMFLEADSKGYVKIHDVVRTSAISFAAKVEGHKFMVEAIPRWMNKKSFGKYTAISLQSGGDFSRLNDVEADKLQILLLKGNLAPDFPDSFFEGMSNNLEVLALSKMNFSPSLPASIGKLKKLRTLHLERCKLGDISEIGELSSLVVLRLRESVLEQELPLEVGNLSNLSLLDMSGCKSNLNLIPVGILDRLSQLEGLYTLDSSIDWELTQTEFHHGEIISNTHNKGVLLSANELNRLHYLNALEMSFSEAIQLPNTAQSVKNLDMFKICVDNIDDAHTKAETLGCHRVLSIGFSDILENCCLKELLKKADWLQLGCRNVEYLVPEVNEDGFRELIFLRVVGADNLKALCGRGDAPLSGMFQKLQTLSLAALEKLEYMLPLAHVPRSLTHVKVIGCHSLNFFFIDNGNELLHGAEETDLVFELPFLKSIDLSYVSVCQSLLGTQINHGLRTNHAFFNKQIGLPCLEQVSLEHCPEIIRLWSKEAGFSGFRNLKEIKIESCNEMINIGSPSVFSALVLLESLTIRSCDKMHQVIIAEETEELEIHGDEVIIFPTLKSITIESSSSLECFYNGRYKLEFPSLKSLSLANLCLMNRFSGLDCSSTAFFSEKDDFPRLEELQVINEENHVNVKRLWDRDISTVEGLKTTVIKNHVPMLRNLTISGTHALNSLPTTISCEHLSSLKLHCFDNQVLFSSSTLSLAFPKLEELWVGNSNSMTELFEEKDNSFREHLKTSHLFRLPELNHLPLDQFKGLCWLHLEGLSWEYVISSADLLQQLQILEISECHKMESIVTLDHDVDGFVIEFPKLKKIAISGMNTLQEFSSSKTTILHLPSLESLTVKDCIAFKQFSSGPITAPCLNILNLVNCSSLERFSSSHPNMTQTLQLPSLEHVEISQCDKLESFSHGRHVQLPKLRQVCLNGCPKMRWFVSSSSGAVDEEGDVELRLPCLETLEIRDCDKMEAFSTRPVMAANLSYVTYEWNKYSLLQYQGLNQFLESKKKELVFVTYGVVKKVFEVQDAVLL